MLRIGDVIETVDDVPITTVEQWRVRAARIGVGDTLKMLVTRRGVQRPVTLDVSTPAADNGTALGLAMRTVAPVGTEVVRVAPGSAAESAGIVAGDVITAIGTLNAPSPAQVGAAFDRMDEGDVTIVAVRRGGVHRVVALQR
jgi:S1-C subfamily serine protease